MHDLLPSTSNAQVSRNDLQELHRPRRNDSDVLREAHRECPGTDSEFNKFHNKVVKDIEKNSDVMDKYFDKGNTFEITGDKELSKNKSKDKYGQLDSDKQLDKNKSKEKSADLADDKEYDKNKSKEKSADLAGDKEYDKNKSKEKSLEVHGQQNLSGSLSRENSEGATRVRQR